MRDKTHEEFIIRWANFVKNNPNKWQKKHAKFINAQINNNKKFLQRLIKEKSGREKIIQLYDIKNINGYRKLLKK